MVVVTLFDPFVHPLTRVTTGLVLAILLFPTCTIVIDPDDTLTISFLGLKPLFYPLRGGRGS